MPTFNGPQNCQCAAALKWNKYLIAYIEISLNDIRH